MSGGWIAAWDELPEGRFTPTVAVRAVNGQGCQLCRFTVEEGTPQMPPIRHEAEQISVLLDGRQVVRLGELRAPVQGGSLWTIPSRVEHASRLVELPSTVLDFHVPPRPEFVADGAEPPRGPEPQRPPRFTSWPDETAEPLERGAELRRLTGERAQLTRLTASGPLERPVALAAGGERIVTVMAGRAEIVAGDRRGVADAGTVWHLPAGAAQTVAVLDGPFELYDFQDIRATQEAA